MLPVRTKIAVFDCFWAKGSSQGNDELRKCEARCALNLDFLLVLFPIVAFGSLLFFDASILKSEVCGAKGDETGFLWEAGLDTVWVWFTERVWGLLLRTS